MNFEQIASSPAKTTAQTTNSQHSIEPSLSPPRIIVSDSKVFHSGVFFVDIVMGDKWRITHGVSMEDIWRGGLHAEVLLEGSPDLRVTSCSKCKQAKTVIELKVSGMPEFGPFSGPQPHSERFRFDNCKSHCSSSRLHLGSRLILAITLPGGNIAFSEPFELLSKKPPLRRRSDPYPEIKLSNTTATIPNQPVTLISQPSPQIQIQQTNLPPFVPIIPLSSITGGFGSFGGIGGALNSPILSSPLSASSTSSTSSNNNPIFSIFSQMPEQLPVVPQSASTIAPPESLNSNSNREQEKTPRKSSSWLSTILC